MSVPLADAAPPGCTDRAHHALPHLLAGIRSRPLVYLTLGSTYRHVGSLRAAAAGLDMRDVDALVAVGTDGDPVALGPLPGSVLGECFLPQGVLLPHVDLVARHGAAAPWWARSLTGSLS